MNADPNAKLRRLRDKMLDCVKCWRPHEGIDGGYWQGRIWTAEYAVQRIDALLAEPEPAEPDYREAVHRALCKQFLDEVGSDMALFDTETGDGVTGDGRRFHAFWFPREAPRRETLEDEIARLYGHEGRA